MESPLLLAAGIASFDMVSGIRVIQSWQFSERIDSFTLTDLFKIMLNNVHRQKEQAYQDLSVSTAEIQSLSCLLVSGIFVSRTKHQSVYFCVGILFDTDAIPRYPEFTDVLVDWTRLLARVTKLRLGQNLPLPPIKDVIDVIAEDISIVARAGVRPSETVEIAPVDFYLYSLLLTAHFQTQMTIVIEAAAGRPEHAQQLARFLSNFALPYQLRLSMIDVLPSPSPHLYVQCVEQQSNLFYADLMLRFGRPVTWVKLPDRRDGQVKIYHSKETLDVQKACHEQFIETEFVVKAASEDTDTNHKFAEIREKFGLVDFTAPAPWALARIALLLSLPDDARRLFCATELGAVMRSAISLVALAHDRAAGGITEQTEREIQAALGLQGKGDWDMVLALARMYDKDIATKLSQRLGAIRRLSSFLGGWNG
jgi:hypothetical protein